MEHVEATARRRRTAVAIFCVSAAIFFIAFTVLNKPPYLQPETILDRYYANQDGLMDGPLRSSLRFRDLLRPFMYNPMTDEFWRCRPLANIPIFFDAKVLVRLNDRFGPFEFYSSQIVVVILAAWALTVFAREWSGDPLTGWLTGAVWLLTYESLAYSVLQTSPAKMGAVFFTYLILFTLLKLRARNGPPGPLRLTALGVFVFFGFLTDDSLYATAALGAVVVFLERDQFRDRWGRLALFGGLGLAAYLVYLHVLGPDLSLKGGTEGNTPYLQELLGCFFADPGGIIRVRIGFNWPDEVWWMARRNSGLVGDFLRSGGVGITPAFLAYLQAHKEGIAFHRPLGLCFWAVLAVYGIRFHPVRATLKFLLMFAVFSAFYYGVYMWAQDCTFRWPVYYSAPPLGIAILVLIPLNRAILAARRSGWLYAWLGLLLCVGLLNANTFIRYGGPFLSGQNLQGPANRHYFESIVHLWQTVQSRGWKLPVYVSYPRPERFEAQDWHTVKMSFWDQGDPDNLYRPLVPLANLRSFERGELRADPSEALAWAGAEPGPYESVCRTFFDLKRGLVVDLDVWRAALPPLRPGEWVYRSSGGDEFSSGLAAGPWGDYSNVRLPAGSYRFSVPGSAGRESDDRCLVLLVRSLVPVRFSPPVGEAVVSEYGRSWEWLTIPLPPGATEIAVAGEGTIEITGPAILPDGYPDRVVYGVGRLGPEGKE